MVDKINNNYTNPYTYNASKAKKIDNDPPAFLLDYDENGVVYERSEDKASEKKNGQQEGGRAAGGFNKEDEYISTIKEQAKKDSTGTNEEATDYIKLARDIVSKVWVSTKNLFRAIFEFIWYGDDGKEKAVETETIDTDGADVAKAAELPVNTDDEEKTEKPKVASKKAERDALLNERLQAAKNGVSGTPARNTDLLTTYDRHGKIVSPRPSEAEKILKGDKSIKL